MCGMHMYLKEITKRKRTALQILVPSINDNRAMGLPFNTSRIKQGRGEVVGKLFFQVSFQFIGFQCLYPDSLWSECEYHPTDHKIE